MKRVFIYLAIVYSDIGYAVVVEREEKLHKRQAEIEHIISKKDGIKKIEGFSAPVQVNLRKIGYFR